MRNRQRARRKDGATDVPASVAPWAMKYRVGDPYTHWNNNIDVMKTTDQSPHAKALIFTSISNLSIYKSAASIERKPTHEVV